jgi:hypothetical protein
MIIPHVGERVRTAGREGKIVKVPGSYKYQGRLLYEIWIEFPSGGTEVNGDHTTVEYIDRMEVRCKKHEQSFLAHPLLYPTDHSQSKIYCKDGDKYIECPFCGRRYFYNDDYETWYADRRLTIIKEATL